MIHDSEIEKALDWLRDQADHVANTRAERVYCVEYCKPLRAIIASASNEGSEAAKERYALSHDRYLEHLEKLKQAVFEDEKNRALRGAAELKIEAWRSQQANMRSMKI